MLSSDAGGGTGRGQAALSLAMMFLGVRLGTHNPNQIDKYRPGALLFPHCLAERHGDQTLNQSNKVWHDRRPFTVFLIALTTTFVVFPLCS